LIAYRRRHDHLLERRAEMRFESRWGGDWTAISFYNKAVGSDTMALVKGHIDPTKPTLVRMHTLSTLTDMFGETSAREGMLAGAMRMIAAEGSGVVVVINRAMHNAVSWQIEVRARRASGVMLDEDIEELRDYGVGAQVLAELGVHDMVLLTNTHHTLVALEGYGLSIVGERKIERVVGERD
jgi:3,4-dihydroxy 2-butanone 4-phosphate synthase/GTP cyclohydrolase II